MDPETVLALAIARGLSRRAAAVESGLSLSTVTRRLRDSQFRETVRQLRADLLERAVGVLADASTAAARELKRLCTSGQNEFARLGAASRILELAGLNQRAIDSDRMQARIAALEDLLKVWKTP